MLASRARARSRKNALRQRLGWIVVGVQLPATMAMIAAGGWWLLGLLVPVALTATFFSSFASPWSLQPASRAHLFLGLYPFFAWFVATAAFALLLPVALLLAPWLPQVWPAAIAVSALAGLASIRRSPRVRRVRVEHPALPAALDGLTVAQISDLHCGPFAPEALVDAWVRRTNALDADVVAVTGDLIAHGDAHIDAVARALGRLRAPRGVFVSLGNHDHFGAGERLVRALEREGLTVLQNAARAAGDGLVVAGVDDTWTRRDDVDRALAAAERLGAGFTLLLAHDPALFPEAVARGAHLTLSGHTHAGQLAVPYLVQRWNLARLVSPYTYGLYRDGDAALYVNPGLGWTGPPVRFGARAEITLLTLRRPASAGPRA
jgi:predicted MPP superfamily phosphohydrolase